MNKPSVLLVGNFLSASGMSRGVCEDLAEQLRGAKWQILTTSAKAGRIARLLDMLKTTWQYRHQYEVAQVDVFSGLGFFWAEVITRLLRHLGKPHILTLHGGNLPVFAKRWSKSVTHMLNRAYAVTVPSPFLLDQMKLYRSDLLLLPNAIDLSRYIFRIRSQPQPQLIWLRAFHKVYNPSLAPRVLARLTAKFPEIRLIMVGPDKGDGSLEETQRIAAAIGVADRIQYSGQVAKRDVPTWFDKGDIFLNTTNVDNTPVSVLEAMACGLCITSTNVGGIPYLLENEQDALLTSPDNPEMMMNAVESILTKPYLAQKLSQNVRSKAEQFDWSAILPQWEILFRSLSNREQPSLLSTR